MQEGIELIRELMSWKKLLGRPRERWPCDKGFVVSEARNRTALLARNAP